MSDGNLNESTPQVAVAVTPADLEVATPANDRSRSPQERAALRRRVFGLAWPVIGENFLETLLGIVDTWFVAFLGAVALAGVGAATQLMFFVISALSAVAVGSAVLVAQAVGARSFEQAGNLAKQSLVWAVFLSLPLVLTGLIAAEPLIGMFGMEPAVNEIGAAYLRVTMGTVFALVLRFIAAGVLRGAGDSRTPMLLTLLSNAINIVLDYALIFGRLGMPELGAVGSAWATFIARSISLLLLLIVLWHGRNGVSIRGATGWWPAWPAARRILGLGVPAAVEQVLITSSFLMQTIVVAQLGTFVLAAQRVSMNAMSLSFLPGFGFAMAATTLVGQSIGARRPDEGQAAARIATLWSMIWMGTLGVVFLLFAESIVGFFSDDPQVIAIGAGGLRVVALSQPFWAIGFVQAGALRGAGDTRFPLWINTTSMWTAVGLGALFVTLFGGNLATIWSAFLLTSPVAAALLWWRFQRTIAGPVKPEV
ncbi:MAG: MATE family efflux transporter [Chloroflexi bacterium]|nr:MAG: MATE family efflux transporter [Chloroflexota bacterium]